MLQLHVVTPLFTGATDDKAAIPNRMGLWMDWLQSDGYHALRDNRRLSVSAYRPGAEIAIPHDKDPKKIRLLFPPDPDVRVPKGLVARLHLLVLLERCERAGIELSNVVFACIDGSGAFHFDSLALLLDRFEEDPEIDVVFGCRPPENNGMGPGRKEIEEFEQYLLFRHRPEGLARTFSRYQLESGLLPDGQAGCWGFRLSAASRLPLTASGYEIEYDLLASAIEAGLSATHTAPLLMTTQERHSSAATDPVGMSIRKLRFIERKLRINRAQVLEGWLDFSRKFAGSETLKGVHRDYEAALMSYCQGEPQ